MTNARTTNYDGAQVYTTPTITPSSVANQIMPSNAPGTANLGIGGKLDGALTTSGYSDFLVHQIQTTTAATTGNTSTMNFQYDEVV